MINHSFLIIPRIMPVPFRTTLFVNGHYYVLPDSRDMAIAVCDRMYAHDDVTRNQIADVIWTEFEDLMNVAEVDMTDMLFCPINRHMMTFPLWFMQYGVRPLVHALESDDEDEPAEEEIVDIDDEDDENWVVVHDLRFEE